MRRKDEELRSVFLFLLLLDVSLLFILPNIFGVHLSDVFKFLATVGLLIFLPGFMLKRLIVPRNNIFLDLSLSFGLGLAYVVIISFAVFASGFGLRFFYILFVLLLLIFVIINVRYPLPLSSVTEKNNGIYKVDILLLILVLLSMSYATSFSYKNGRTYEDGIRFYRFGMWDAMYQFATIKSLTEWE